MSADPRATTPAEIRKLGRERLRITWADGRVSEFAARFLRGRCPCAMCVDENSGRRRVGEGEVAADVGLARLQLVGNYALQVEFSDGHATGLFSFDYLRAIGESAAPDSAGT